MTESGIVLTNIVMKKLNEMATTGRKMKRTQRKEKGTSSIFPYFSMVFQGWAMLKKKDVQTWYANCFDSIMKKSTMFLAAGGEAIASREI